MPSSTVEDYIKRLYCEQESDPNSLVPMGRLAEVMNVVPGTATAMIKALDDSGLVRYEPREGARLTPGGEKLALHVLRRHRLVELFLCQTLGLNWAEVHDEAEQLEHSMSDKVIERIDALLGYPRVDPHGAPIPCADGTIALQSLKSLSTCAAGQTYKIVRVVDTDAPFLQFAEKHGLLPESLVTVKAREESADAIVIHSHSRNRSCTLGISAAGKLFVESVTESG